MKIIFFGSTNLALPVLEELRKDHEILSVVTTPDAKAGRRQENQETPVSALAKDLKLPLLKPESLKNNPEFLNTLKELGADLWVVVAYGKILPPEYLELPKYKILNVHPSVLPKYRGPSPIRTALLNGDEYTGVTFILLDELPDHGPMLGQQVVKIEADDNDFMLTDKLARVSAGMINQIITDYTSGKLTPLPQDDAAATETGHVSKEDGKIDWTKTAEQIYNQFRAFYPWPGIWTTWNGKMLKITDCKATELPNEYESTERYRSGQIVDSGVVICGGNTALQINNLQLEGKNETPIADFLNGYREFVGAVLE